jgi:polyhydroxyalkanoate depolymerase
MIYAAYQAQADLMDPLRQMARMSRRMMDIGFNGFGDTPFLRNIAAGLEMVERAGLSHARPAFAIDAIEVGNRLVDVVEEVSLKATFGSLLHFRKDVDQPQPRVLVVAPLSGHFATLLHGTVKTLLPDHDVYVTDWHNARDVPLSSDRSASTIMSRTSSSSWRPSAKAPMCSRCASPASRCSPPPR